ncbi:Uncharacterized protein RNJ44_03973 [Nakaseomyces bracarensis]|uniref:Glutathione peroxidase n=1 Tax=Nakaseomyces bracarensis TaxID=273131 RepID=A0ABR4NYW0_9SACH
MTNFYDLCPLDQDGKQFPFSKLKGKVVLIVNVASKCNFTPQYRDLQLLYERYHEEGLEIIAFPCNQFGQQEPGSDDVIRHFCLSTYGVSFPVLKKIKVNGPNADPVYQFLKSTKHSQIGLKVIRWNFEKFLIDKNGEVHERYSCLTSPLALETAIETLLNKDKT